MSSFCVDFTRRLLILFTIFLLLTWVDAYSHCIRPQSPCTSCSLNWVRSNSDCRQYYVCFNGNPIKFRCPATLAFSVSTRVCVSETDSRNDCDVRPYDISGMYDTKTPQISPEFPKQPSCGVKIERRIVGGLPSTPGEWPWMISLQIDQDGYRHFCGAALINDQWLVTAGHCVSGYPRGKMTAVMGMYRLSTPERKQVRRGILRVLVHPDFVNTYTLPNDIALLQLADRVDIGEVSIGSVCLPESNEEFVEGSCWVTGWGQTRGTGNSDVLNELRVSLIDRNTCREKWGNYIDTSHICVGNGNEGVCKGDSGSPLVCFRRGSYVLAGVTSWGSIACNTPNFPNVYTRVSSYTAWINRQMELYTPPAGYPRVKTVA